MVNKARPMVACPMIFLRKSEISPIFNSLHQQESVTIERNSEYWLPTVHTISKDPQVFKLAPETESNQYGTSPFMVMSKFWRHEAEMKEEVRRTKRLIS